VKVWWGGSEIFVGDEDAKSPRSPIHVNVATNGRHDQLRTVCTSGGRWTTRNGHETLRYAGVGTVYKNRRNRPERVQKSSAGYRRPISRIINQRRRPRINYSYTRLGGEPIRTHVCVCVSDISVYNAHTELCTVETRRYYYYYYYYSTWLVSFGLDTRQY